MKIYFPRELFDDLDNDTKARLIETIEGRVVKWADYDSLGYEELLQFELIDLDVYLRRHNEGRL